MAITADASSINDDIVDAFDDVGYNKLGEDHGKEYAKNFQKHLETDLSGSLKRSLDNLQKAFDSDDTLRKSASRMVSLADSQGSLDAVYRRVAKQAGVSFSDEFDDTIRRSVRKTMEKTIIDAAKSGAGDDLLRQVVASFGANGGKGSFLLPGNAVEDMVKGVRAGLDESRRDYEKAAKDYTSFWETALKDREDQEKLGLAIFNKIEADRLRTLQTAHRMNKKFDADRLKAVFTAHRINDRLDADHLKMLAVADRMNKKFNADRLKELYEAHRINTKFDTERMVALQRMGKMQEAALRMNEKFAAGQVDGRGQSVSRNKETAVGARVGKMLGAGSRNNAINLIGRSLGGITGLIVKVTKGFAGLFSTFADGMAQAGSSASTLAKIGAGFGAVGGRIVAMGAAMTVAAPIVLVALAAIATGATILVSVLSAAVSMVVALASTVASGLVGALAVGAGAFAAIGIAAGLATMAFRSMTDEQKKQAAATFEPIHAMATGLGQIMIQKMIPAFAAWSKNLQTALALIKPLAEVMGGAFARAGTILTESLSGPGIRMFIDVLGTTLPRIVTNLSKAFGNFLNGVSGVFTAIMPFVQRFSGYLARVSEDFAKWATSTKGQNSITDFVDRALVSLSALWDFIKSVGSLIADLLFDKNGQKAGNSIFKSMENGVRDLATYLGKEDRLENWFKDGKKFAKALGDTIETVSDILEDLNNSKVIDVFADLASFAETAADAIDKIPGSVSGVISALTPMIGTLQKAWDLIGLIKGSGNIGVDVGRPGVPGTVPGTSGGPSGTLGNATGDSVITAEPEPWATDAIPRMIKKATEETDKFGRSWKRARKDAKDTKDVIDSLIKSGTNALNQTSESNGGHMLDPVSGNGSGSNDGASGSDPKKKKKKWKNPYLDYANSILAQAPTLADEIKKTMIEARGILAAALAESTKNFADLLSESGTSIMDGLGEAVKSTDVDSVIESLQGIITSVSAGASAALDTAMADGQALMAQATATRDQMVAAAQAAVQAAASDLAGASNKKEAKAALAVLEAAKADLVAITMKGGLLVQEANEAANSMLGSAFATKDRIDAATAILAAQSVTDSGRVNNLISGIMDTNSTLADYAEARRIVAERLVEANQSLADAISMRDNYSASVSDSVKAFGSLMTAQAKTLNGIEQALTSGDITENLRDRLAKIKAFQDNLRILLAQGLSDAAYQQLVDAGVESGGAFAQALVNGGQGGISEVNDLTAQIGNAASGLGLAASSHLYQAGVDAAQGLVDGLVSLSGDLDTAAAALGKSIADAIKRELGIASPSKVMYGLMFDNVGDGVVNGLDAAAPKVGAAASRLAGLVAVSPEVATYANSRGTSATADAEVSGNSDTPKWLWTGDIVTPTEDPHAVANEVMNELTGRLT